MHAKFSGILKAIGPELTAKAVAVLPEMGGRPLKPKHWHVTLVHQSLLKPHRKFLKTAEFLPLPNIEFEPVSEESHRQSIDPNTKELRESWVLWTTPETQVALQKWVDEFVTSLGVQEREDRRFHLSVSNLTGNPGDSVR